MVRTFLAAVCLTAGTLSAAEFMPLNDDPGSFQGAAFFLSDDGDVVVGADASHRRVFVWNEESGVNVLDLPPGYEATTGGRSGPISLIDEGETLYVTASRFVAGEGYLDRGRFTWTADEGYRPFDGPGDDFAIRAVRDDGRLLIGNLLFDDPRFPDGASREAAIWTEESGETKPLGAFDLDHLRGTIPTAVSHSGAVVVGRTDLASRLGWENHFQPALISVDGEPFRELPSLTGARLMVPKTVDDDASLIIGYAGLANPAGESFYEPYVWRKDQGYVALGAQARLDSATGETSYGIRLVEDASTAGDVIVGYQSCTDCIGDSWREAFLWDPWHGFRSLRDVLIDEYALADQLLGWNLESVEAISPDGKVLVGEGLLDGRIQPWRVELDDLAPPSLLPGDANLDGVVSLADYAVLRTRLGAGGYWYQGDFDGDGLVGLSDQQILFDAFGAKSASAPEPTTLVQLFLGGLVCAVYRRLRSPR